MSANPKIPQRFPSRKVSKNADKGYTSSGDIGLEQRLGTAIQHSAGGPRLRILTQMAYIDYKITVIFRLVAQTFER